MLQLFALASFAQAVTCPTYTCSKSLYTSHECISHSTKSGVDRYTITPCEENLLCQYNPGSSSQCTYYPPRTRFPGEYCETNLDCMSNYCATDPVNKNDKYCFGQDTGNTTICNSTADCNPGLYCNGTQCIPHLKYGDNCTRDEQCYNGAVCDNSTCTKMFSLANGTNTTVMWGSFAPACSTGYASSSGSGTSMNWTCSTAPVSMTSTVTACPSSGLCVASNGVSSKNCECGYSGKAYCPLFEGDGPVVSMISAWQKLFDVSELYCNGLSRWSYGCFYAMSFANNQHYVDYLAWVINATKYFNGTWYKDVNAPQCVMDTILMKFRNLEYDYQRAQGGYQQCAGYSEVSDTAGWASGQCVYYTNNLYSDNILNLHFAAKCAKGTVCSFQENTNCTCQPWEQTLGFPGDYCKKGTECYSGTCSKNRCTGQGSGQNCSAAQNTLYCSPGYFCNSQNVCESVNAVSSCSGDSQCNSTSLCLNGNCTLRFSVPNGSEGRVNYGSGFGYSESCASGFAYEDSISGRILCGAAPTTSGVGYMNECKGGTVTDTSGKFSNPCMCGLSGKAYYEPFTGDGKYIYEVIRYFKKFSSKTSCFSNKWTPACVKYKSDYLYDYYQYYVNQQILLKGPIYKNSQKNIQEMFASDYYNATKYISDESSSSSSSFAAALIAGLGLALIA